MSLHYMYCTFLSSQPAWPWIRLADLILTSVMSPTSMPLTSYSSETLRAKKKISELLVINFNQALRCKTQIFVMGYLQFLHDISERFDNYLLVLNVLHWESIIEIIAHSSSLRSPCLWVLLQNGSHLCSRCLVSFRYVLSAPPTTIAKNTAKMATEINNAS